MNATAELPIEGASVADLCRAKLRAMFAPYREPVRRVEPGEAIWLVCNERERAFLCRAAKVDGALIAASWRELPEHARADILTAWERLADWVHRVELHADAVKRGRHA